MTGFPKNYFDDVDNIIIKAAKNSEDARDEKYGILRELTEEDAERIRYTESNIRKVKVSMMDFMLINAASVLLGRKPLGMMSDDQQRWSRFIDLVRRIHANHTRRAPSRSARSHAGKGISDTAISKKAKSQGWDACLRSGADHPAPTMQTSVPTSTPTKQEPDERGLEFDWIRCREDVVVPSQPAIAVYTNPDHAIVIRQESPDEDRWVFVQRKNLHALIWRLQEFADQGPFK